MPKRSYLPKMLLFRYLSNDLNLVKISKQPNTEFNQKSNDIILMTLSAYVFNDIWVLENEVMEED